jgi:hypothetical protein
MKWTLVAVLVTMAACGPNSETPEQRLIGKWAYSDTSSWGGLQFYSTSAYGAETLQPTSTTTANEESERGVFSASETEITFTPQGYSCPGPEPVYTLPYQFNGDVLVVTYQTGSVSLSPNTAFPSWSASVTYGCFQSDGSFVEVTP